MMFSAMINDALLSRLLSNLHHDATLAVQYRDIFVEENETQNGGEVVDTG